MTVKTLAPHDMTLKTASRWIKIRFGIKETTSPYFIKNGERIHLDWIMRTSSPIMYRDEEGRDGVISGYLCLCNWGGYLLEIHPDCEYVRLWEELDNVQ